MKNLELTQMETVNGGGNCDTLGSISYYSGATATVAGLVLLTNPVGWVAGALLAASISGGILSLGSGAAHEAGC